jgi:hypothetical protein
MKGRIKASTYSTHKNLDGKIVPKVDDRFLKRLASSVADPLSLIRIPYHLSGICFSL